MVVTHAKRGYKTSARELLLYSAYQKMVIRFQRPIVLKSLNLTICMWHISKEQLVLFPLVKFLYHVVADITNRCIWGIWSKLSKLSNWYHLKMLSKLYLTTKCQISKLNIFPEIHKRKKRRYPELRKKNNNGYSAPTYLYTFCTQPNLRK